MLPVLTLLPCHTVSVMKLSVNYGMLV